METKVVKKFKYLGLGVEVTLLDITLYKVNRVWVPKIDVEKLSEKLFTFLTYKSGHFTGAEINFIRTYMESSKSEFGRQLGVSHTAVAKWERSGKRVTTMILGTELLLKMIMAQKSGVAAIKYQEIFQKSQDYKTGRSDNEIVLDAA